MVFQAAEDISSMLSLGAMYPTAALEEALAMANGPAEAGYTGEGNMVRVGNSNLRVSSSVSFYNGIWGYATGECECAGLHEFRFNITIVYCTCFRVFVTYFALLTLCFSIN